MMRQNILIFLLFISQIKLIKAQVSTINDFDSFLVNAITLSEKALYDARLQEAKEIIQTSYFESFAEYSAKHEIILTLQDIRIGGFMSIIYQLKSYPSDNFERLNKLLPFVQGLEDKNVQGNYYRTLSSAHRSIGNTDSALVYEKKAAQKFKESRDFEKLAELKANQISRIHNQLLRDGKKEEILALIPKYEAEIKFSSEYSRYALAYNTRHLAQIHRRQTLNYDEALRLFKISLSLREEIGFRPFIPASYSSIGDIYVKMEEYESAIAKYTKAAELAEEIDFVRYQINPLISIADIYIKKGMKENAREYLGKALKVASEKHSLERFDEILEKITLLEK